MARADMEKRDRILGFTVAPLTRRRIDSFKRNRRGYWSLWIFLGLFVFSLFAEFIANDKPIMVKFDDAYYMPIFKLYPETTFGGEFPTETDYRDPFVAKLIGAKGWMLWPPVRYSYNTPNYFLAAPSPAPPSADNWLGTDDQARDVTYMLIDPRITFEGQD